jgi:hypothetical protein
LIPLYAIGVFTSFTLSQLGMSIRHLKLREPKWRLGLVINGTGALATGVVTVVIAATKFTEGAWAVMLLVPILVMTLVRLNHQYEKEAAVLHSHEAGQALVGLRQPVPTTHVAVVFVDRLDAAAARALHVARTLRADRTEAVHLGIDDHRVEQVRDAWSMVAINGLDLRVIDVPDRDLTHAAQSFCARLMADGHTQVSVLIPRLEHRKAWHRILHDRTSERLADALVKLPNANVTFVPFHLGEPIVPLAEGAGLGAHHHHHLHLHHHDGDGAGVAPSALPPGSIGSVAWRSRAVVEGRVVELGVEQSADTPSLVVTVDDGTGRIDLLFLGRRDIGGVVLGARVRAEGMAAAHRHRLSMLNPTVDVLALPAHH